MLLAPASWGVARQRGEHLATGVPSGMMGRTYPRCSARAGHALLIDGRTLGAEPIALPDALAVLVVDSGLPRTLADSAYAEWRG